MKIHAKLGGVTHAVNVTQAVSPSSWKPIAKLIGSPQLDKTTLMVGAEVSHSGPRFSGAIPPSIAVSVAGINGDQDRFLPAIRLQEGRV
jgi:eukaryotic translation initiation factor 2C